MTSVSHIPSSERYRVELKPVLLIYVYSVTLEVLSAMVMNTVAWEFNSVKW